MGANERLRAVLDGYTAGANLTIGVVGGSISVGHGVTDGSHNVYPFRLRDMLNSTRQAGYGHVSVFNGAVAGTLSMYMSACARNHLPEQVDVVLVEYAVNDLPGHEIDSDERRGFERLLRKLLRFPRRPAVVLVNTYKYFLLERTALYWSNVEASFSEYASYYGLPSVSLKAAAHELMEAGSEGFWVNTTRMEWQRDPQRFEWYSNRAFYYDVNHPDGGSGHRALSELLFHLFSQVLLDLQDLPMSGEERRRAQELPPPMVEGNFESLEDKCLIGQQFVKSVQRADGWQWVNEAPDKPRPKWGFVASAAGAVLEVGISTLASSKPERRPWLGGSSGAGEEKVLVEVAYLRSYEHMGVAVFACSGGCQCNSSQVDAHHVERTSQVYLHMIPVTQSQQCILSVTVASTTRSGEQKFKVIGLIVSEQAGTKQSVQAAGALEYVSEIAARDPGGKFNVLNHVRRRALQVH